MSAHISYSSKNCVWTSSIMDPVRIGATVDPPYSQKCFYKFPKFCLSPGTDIEYIHMVLVNMLHLNVKLILYDSYAAVDNALDIGDIDINGLTYAYDPESIQRWHYTLPVFSYTIGLVVKTKITTNASSTFSLLYIFDYQLWLLLIATCTIVILYKIILTFVFKECPTATKSANLIYVLWFAIFSIILNLFGNLIAVDLMIPTTVIVTPFETVSELGEKLLTKQCRFVLLSVNENASEFYDTLINPTHSKNWSKIYQTAFIINPPLFVDSRSDIYETVNDHECMVGVDYTQVSGNSFYANYCGIETMTFIDEFTYSSYAYYFNSSNLKLSMDTIITSEAFYAYSNEVRKKYFPQRTSNCKAPRVTGVLNLSKFTDSFIILFFGITLSALIVTLQNVITLYRFRKRLRLTHTTLMKKKFSFDGLFSSNKIL